MVSCSSAATIRLVSKLVGGLREQLGDFQQMIHVRLRHAALAALGGVPLGGETGGCQDLARRI